MEQCCSERPQEPRAGKERPGEQPAEDSGPRCLPRPTPRWSHWQAGTQVCRPLQGGQDCRNERTGPQSSRVPGPHSQEQPREARGWPDPSRHPKMAASETQEGWYGPNVITQICGSEVLTRCLKGSWFHTVSSHSCAVVGSVGLGQEAGLSAQLFRLAEPQFPHR